MIVISNPSAITDEISIINSLFEEGMILFHIRKPNFGESEMRKFLTDINQLYRERLVLHSHHHLAKEFNIKRLHFSESKRKVILMLPGKTLFDTYKTSSFNLSTSVHRIEDFNALDNIFEYVFLGPIYPSISKENYFSKIDQFEAIKNRNDHTTKLIALGGICSENIKTTLEKGFDNVALLGTIWNNNKPIENFKICQQIALSY